MLPDRGEITQMLAAVRQGEDGALDRLLPLVYRELHLLAHRQLNRVGPHTLSTTALVHEAYLKLVDQNQAQWRDRTHFMAVSAVAMRHILVDYARRRSALKRGGDVQQVVLDELRVGVDTRAAEILALDQALDALSHLEPRLGRLVELRFFGGLTVEETAEVLEISERTVKRDWRKARAFLHRKLSAQGTTG